MKDSCCGLVFLRCWILPGEASGEVHSCFEVCSNYCVRICGFAAVAGASDRDGSVGYRILFGWDVRRPGGLEVEDCIILSFGRDGGV